MKELGRCLREPVLRLSDQADSCQSAQLHKPGGHIRFQKIEKEMIRARQWK